MIVGRVIGWLVLLAGFSVLTRDVMVWIDRKIWVPVALGQLQLSHSVAARDDLASDQSRRAQPRLAADRDRAAKAEQRHQANKDIPFDCDTTRRRGEIRTRDVQEDGTADEIGRAHV